MGRRGRERERGRSGTGSIPLITMNLCILVLITSFYHRTTPKQVYYTCLFIVHIVCPPLYIASFFPSLLFHSVFPIIKQHSKSHCKNDTIDTFILSSLRWCPLAQKRREQIIVCKLVIQVFKQSIVVFGAIETGLNGNGPKRNPAEIDIVMAADYSTKHPSNSTYQGVLTQSVLT